MKVLVLGANGFVGRYIRFHLRSHGVKVLAHARQTSGLTAMGFTKLESDLTALLAKTTFQPRGFHTFLNSRPAGTQDLWQARLYLLKPVLRLTLALLWLASAAIGLLLPSSYFLSEVAALPAPFALVLARGGGLIDAGGRDRLAAELAA